MGFKNKKISLTPVIHSKPKPNTIFALSTFVVLSFVGAGFNIKVILVDGDPAWFNYLIAAILLPIAVLVMLKVMWSFKSVNISKERFQIRYPLRFINRRYGLNQLASWHETTIKTNSGLFRELTILFEKGFKVTLTFQENTDYTKVLSYLQKKASKKQQKSD